MKNYSKIALSLSALAVLVGCGSSGSSENVGTGYYEDGVIVGVDYKCGSRTGVTGDKGVFAFDFNKSCEFSIGDVILETRQSSEFKRDKPTIRLKNDNAGQILAVLDIDGNPDNGFIIENSAAKIALKELNVDNIDDLNASNTDINKVIEVYSNNLKEHKGEYKKPDFDKLKEDLLNHQESQTENVLKGKTFYIPYVEGKANEEIIVTTFNENVTEVSFGKEKVKVELDGNNIIIGESEHWKITSFVEGKYVQIYTEFHGNIKLYVNRADAEARLKEIKDNSTITEAKAKSLIGKTLFEAEKRKDSSGKWVTTVNEIKILKDKIIFKENGATKEINLKFEGTTLVTSKNGESSNHKLVFLSDEKAIFEDINNGQTEYTKFYFNKDLAIEYASIGNQYDDNNGSGDQE